MSPSLKKKIFPVVLLVLLFISAGSVFGDVSQAEYYVKRAKLLSYILRNKLTTLHYSHKKMDDQLSRDAFGLYLKQLDSQKRFLLADDVEQLRAYSTRIDDEIITGRIELPMVGAVLLKKRGEEVREIVRAIIADTIDLTGNEQLETDVDKLEYCKNKAELRVRWRKILKYQLLLRYLNMMEDEGLPIVAPGRNDEPETESSEELWQQARQKILKSYETFFARMLKENEEDHYDRYFNSVTRAYDPHTNYLPPTKKEDFDIHMSGSLEGIGALLREEDGYIKVVRIIPGSAAFRQGQLQAEDIILQVAEADNEPVDITDSRIRDAVALIRGKKGTEVRLLVKKPDSTRITIPIIRDVVQIEETFVKTTLLEDGPGGQRYGYIKIPSFYRDFNGRKNGGSGRNVTDDLRRELEQLAGRRTDGLILDLRNNGGGALEDAVSVAGLFIESGPVVQIKDSSGDITVLADKDGRVNYSGPIVVLASKFSASASEILAGALQDYNRAIIVGSDHTHGKGTVQTMIDLNYNLPFFNMGKYRPLGALKVTTQKFYRVSGDSTQFRGVTPDIILPDRMQHLKSGEQYNDFSLPWDTVAPTAYRQWPNQVADISLLRKRSRGRVDENQAFADIIAADKAAEAKGKKTLQSLKVDDILQQFAKERQQQKKLAGANFGHRDTVDGEDEGDKSLTPAELESRWQQEVNSDPYVKEAVSILYDMQQGEKLSKL
jgi:carboxyl-terminal processing protease